MQPPSIAIVGQLLTKTESNQIRWWSQNVPVTILPSPSLKFLTLNCRSTFWRALCVRTLNIVINEINYFKTFQLLSTRNTAEQQTFNSAFKSNENRLRCDCIGIGMKYHEVWRHRKMARNLFKSDVFIVLQFSFSSIWWNPHNSIKMEYSNLVVGCKLMVAYWICSSFR